MHSATTPGVEFRFVNYHWQPALFEALEKGSSSVPEARRNWVVARVIFDDRPLSIAGTLLPVGNYALALWPNLDGKGMALEMRRVDMREVGNGEVRGGQPARAAVRHRNRVRRSGQGHADRALRRPAPGLHARSLRA